MQTKTVVIIPSAQNHTEFFKMLTGFMQARDINIIIIAIRSILTDLEPLNKSGRLTLIARRPDENMYAALRRCHSTIKAADSFVFDEPYESIKFVFLAFLFLNRKAMKYLIVHNANRWFVHYSTTGFKSYIAMLMKKYIINSLRGLVAINPFTQEYLEQVCGYPKKVLLLPFVLPEGEEAQEKALSDCITIAIPGMVDVERRDYGPILTAVERLAQRIEKKICLKFVGNIIKGPGNKAIVERAKALSRDNENIAVKFWEDRLPFEQFDIEIRQSDLILASNKLFYKDANTREVYGLTKESGTNFLMLSYAKPGIVQSSCVVRKDLAGQVCSFGDASDLERLLLELVQNSEALEKLNERAKENSRKFKAAGLNEIDIFVKVLQNEATARV